MSDSRIFQIGPVGYEFRRCNQKMHRSYYADQAITDACPWCEVDLLKKDLIALLGNRAAVEGRLAAQSLIRWAKGGDCGHGSYEAVFDGRPNPCPWCALTQAKAAHEALLESIEPVFYELRDARDAVVKSVSDLWRMQGGSPE